MNILNTKNLVLSILFLLSFCLNLNAQKPKKIFNFLQENQLSLAVEEYNKISSDKEYDKEEKVLFAYAKCLFQIDTNYQKYNPTQAIKEFNGINVSSEYKESIYNFFGKYSLSPEVINQKIINEIYKEAIKLNSIESYTNALNYYSKEHNDNTIKLLEIAKYNTVKSSKDISQLKSFISTYPVSIYKAEIQNLIERETLNNYKSINNIDSLNQFITQFNSSVFTPEVVDFRDSLVLSKVPKNYDSLLRYTIDYPNSKYKKEVEKSLPNVLFEKVKISDYNLDLCQVFRANFSKDIRNIILDSIIFHRLKNSFESEFNFKNIVNRYIDNKMFISQTNKSDIFSHMIVSLILSDDENFGNKSLIEKKLIYNYLRNDFLIKYKVTFGFKDLASTLVPEIDKIIYDYYTILNAKNNLSNNEEEEDKKLVLKNTFIDYYFDGRIYFSVINNDNFYQFHCSYGTATSVNVSVIKYLDNKNLVFKEFKVLGLNRYHKYIETIAGKNYINMNDNIIALFIKKLNNDGNYEYDYEIRGNNDPQCCARYEFVFFGKLNFNKDVVTLENLNLKKWKDSENGKWNIIN